MIRTRETRGKRIVFWCIALAILVPGTIGFIDKLGTFIRTLGVERGAGFTLVPLANYFIMAIGMICLLVWAVTHGMFRDVEGPKYTMLDQEDELNRREFPGRRPEP